MSAQINTFLTALAAVTASAILALALAEPAAPVQPQQEIVKLERVVVIGKRSIADAQQAAQRIEKLPRVVVTGRRADAAMQVAMACAVLQGC